MRTTRGFLTSDRTDGHARRVRFPDGELVVGFAERDFRLNAKGMPNIHDIYRAYDSGYTVVINKVHCRESAVAGLCRALENALHHPVGANLYLTPRNGQGFAPHMDTHDVFILQLHGTKEWHVGNPLRHLPLPLDEQGEVELLDFRKFTLTPGDVLYLPRGFPHEALTSASSSLYLTVGVYAYRWLDLMIETLSVLADDNVQFRSALPPKFLSNPLGAAHTSELFKIFADAFAGHELPERAKERLGAKLVTEAKVAEPGHFRSLDAIQDLTGDSTVFRSPGLLCKVRLGPTEASIAFSNNFVAGPLLLEPALRFVADHERFAVRELPGEMTSEDKLDLVRRLISEGFLRMSNPSGGS
ncbi:cupin domain-containing protein [Streptomyces sp. NPDC005496]|uniref:cupin domain-containing protein n=1 Tax=Streptomyces sp. NPDC005496 TaxID=3364716 RepID=UPI00369471F4